VIKAKQIQCKIKEALDLGGKTDDDDDNVAT
jgi:hypothetical protein